MIVAAALAGASVAAVMVWQSFAEVPPSWLWFALRWLVLLLPYAVLLGLVAYRGGAGTLGYASGIAWTAFALVLAFLVLPVNCWVSTIFCLGAAEAAFLRCRRRAASQPSHHRAAAGELREMCAGGSRPPLCARRTWIRRTLARGLRCADALTRMLSGEGRMWRQER